MAQILTESRPELRFELVAEAFDRNYQNQLLLNHICSNCPFYIEDCDFTSFCPPQDCLPCGGLVFISNLLKLGKITEQQLKLADLKELGDKSYVRLTNNSCVKRLEENYIYHIARDELYEINQEALDFVTKCDGTTTISALDPDREFLEFCVSEDLIQVVKEQTPRALIIGKSPIPSLRYL
ncbi:MAG: hypothetical protein ACP5VS_12910, partial [Desulfomonilaceae bacterium]